MSHPLIFFYRCGSKQYSDVTCDCVDGKCERHSMCEVPIGYLCGRKPPNYPVPAEIITFDYWSAEMTDSGKPALYGHRLYKPGRWLEFLAVE